MRGPLVGVQASGGLLNRPIAVKGRETREQVRATQCRALILAPRALALVKPKQALNPIS